MKKKKPLISCKSREGREVGMKGKWYKDSEKTIKKPPPNLVLILLHFYYLLSEADFVVHPKSAHKDFTANFTLLRRKY